MTHDQIQRALAAALADDRLLRAADLRENLPPSGGVAGVLVLRLVADAPRDGVADGCGFVVRCQGHRDGHRAPPLAVSSDLGEAERLARVHHARRVDRAMPLIARIDYEPDARVYRHLANAAAWADRAACGIQGAAQEYERRCEHAEDRRVHHMAADAAQAESEAEEKRQASEAAALAASKAAEDLHRLTLEAEAASAAARSVPDGLRIHTPNAVAA